MTLRSHQKLPVPTKCRLPPPPWSIHGAPRTWSIPRQCCPHRAPPEDSWSPPGVMGENGGLPWRPGLCQLLWGFPFCFHSFCMFHIFRAKRIRGGEKLHSSEERPTYTPTVARASSASLCANKAARMLARERYINPHPIAGDGRAAEAQPGASSRCSKFRPEKQSLLIYFPLTFLAALLRFGVADAELLSPPGLCARGGAGADQAGLQVRGCWGTLQRHSHREDFKCMEQRQNPGQG